MDNAIIKSDDKDDIRALSGSLLGAPLIRIAGGTDEILRNIIAEQVLGMPQDVRVDKTVPFNEIRLVQKLMIIEYSALWMKLNILSTTNQSPDQE